MPGRLFQHTVSCLGFLARLALVLLAALLPATLIAELLQWATKRELTLDLGRLVRRPLVVTMPEDLWPMVGYVALALAGAVVVQALLRGDFRIIYKQMRQRALGSWLTLLSVLLGTALAIAIILLQRGAASLFGQTEYGYDVLIGSGRGSPLTLVLNSVYHIDKSPGNIHYGVYEEVAIPRRYMPGQFNYFQHVKLAVPFAKGDTYRGRPIVGTQPRMFGIDDEGKPFEDPEKVFQYRPGKRYELAEGRLFFEKYIEEAPATLPASQPATQPATQPAASVDLLAPAAPASAPAATARRHKWIARFEAVIGAEVARNLHMKVGDTFRATHGASQESGEAVGGAEEHAETWTIVGVLKPTGTAADRAIYVPLTTFYAIGGHGMSMEEHDKARMGMAAGTRPLEAPQGYLMRPDGTIEILTDPSKWELSGIFVKSRGGFRAEALRSHINTGGITEAMAASPAGSMREFFDTFLKPGSTLLLWISRLVSVVAAVGILVSIYNSVAARNREIAILRALGATRGRVLVLICLEAGLIGLIGGVLGWLVGHGTAGVASSYMNRYFGQGFDWIAVSGGEVLYLGFVVAIAVLAGLVPALKAYSTPVATNLVAA